MMKREELIRSKEYWLAQMQSILYQNVEEYLKEHRMTKSQFAQKLGVSKGYISQILNGDFDHKLSKLIELSLMIDKVPMLKFEDIDKVLMLDKEKKLNEPGSSSESNTKHYNLDREQELKKETGWVVNDGDETKT